MVGLLALALASCSPSKREENLEVTGDRKDIHTYGNPEQIQVTNVDLNLTADFDKHVLSGSAVLTLNRNLAYRTGPVILDTRALTVKRTECSADLVRWSDCHYDLGRADAILGSSLTVQLPENARFVRIEYATSPDASGLQWLTPAQTAGKKMPYMFSQSQAIHARSWVPLQDSPGVRVTYSAKIKTPPKFMAVMSAENPQELSPTGEYSFRMTETIPTYLLALAIGDIAFKPLGKRTGVYAEPSVLDKAAREFSDTETMMQAAEQLYGAYRWKRYDVLVLPPSFPFGGMENPRLTFATPTILAGDKSLVDTISHELAHSWSGNLVTNATWSDFWLNEGFTTYLTLRIQEKVFGPERAEMETVLERQVLDRLLKELPAKDQVLHIDLKGRDPDDASTELPYTKGMIFLRTLEEAYGRERFDPFLRSYFDRFAFQSITTADFVEYLKQNLFALDPEIAKNINLDEWLYKPGLPANAYKPSSQAFSRIDKIVPDFESGKMAASALPGKSWSTQEWLYFLRGIRGHVDKAKLADLDRAFKLTQRDNAEIEAQWLLLGIENHYDVVMPKVSQFLTTVGRRKYIEPLYKALKATPSGKEAAKSIYSKARPGYHPIASNTIDRLLQ